MNTPSIVPAHENGQNGATRPTTVVAVPPPPAPIRDDFSFKDLLDLIGRGLLIIRSKWYWGLLGAIIIGGGVGYALFTRPVEFTAQTALLAQSTLDKVIGTQTQADFGGDQARENNLRNHLSMMNSRRFRARLIASFTPEERKEIAGPYLSPGQPKPDDEFFQSFLARKVSIERERGREYYTISVTHLVPKTAIMIADRMASQYLSYVQNEFREANTEGYRLLEKQAGMIREDLAKIESERLDFRKRNGIISRTENQGILAERLKRLDASLTEARIKRVGLETLVKQAVADRAKSEYPWDNAYLAGFANNETLRQELDKYMAERAVLATRYGPNHPKLRDVDSQIKATKASIQRNFDVAVKDLAAQLDVVVRSEQQLKKEFDAAFASSIEIEKLASTYEILGAGVESKKITLNELEKKIGEASISSKLPADFMQIVDPAYIVKPRIPKPVLYAGIAACLGLLGFILTPLLVSTLDERLSSTADVEEVLGVPMLAAIPKLKMRTENRAHVVRDGVDTVTTEAFMGIAGHVDLNSAQSYPKVLMVTSTLPEEGKSLVASNLASTYQRLEKRCVLLDLDLRRPSQHALHGFGLDGGFLTWARTGFVPEAAGDAQAPIDPNGLLAVKTLPDGVDLITAGGHEPQPGNFLVGKALERLIGRLKQRYDVVILDTSPAGVFQDALVLARFASDSILVAREGVAPVVQIRKVIDDFSRANVQFLGAVLNGFSPGNANKKLAYAYSAATKGYSYGSQTRMVDYPIKTRGRNGADLARR